MRTNTDKSACRGFTLLEIVLALTIFALVLTAIYSSWIGILKSSKIGSEAAADVQRSRIAMQTIEDSLTCARSFAADVKHYSFLAENGSEPSLSFVARLPDTFPRSGAFGVFDVRRVTFAVEKGDSGGRLVLRQNPILMDESKVEEEHPLVLAKNVSKFEMEFWDTVTKDWTDEWTKTNQLPLLVKVTLELNAAKNNNNSASSYSVTRVVGVPSLMVAQSWQSPTGGRGGAPGGLPVVQPGVGGRGGGIIIPVPGAR